MEFQARRLEWLPFPSPGDLPIPGMEPRSLVSLALVDGLFITSTTWEAHIYIYTEEGVAPTPVFLPGESHGQRSLVGYVHSVAQSRT